MAETRHLAWADEFNFLRYQILVIYQPSSRRAVKLTLLKSVDLQSVDLDWYFDWLQHKWRDTYGADLPSDFVVRPAHAMAADDIEHYGSRALTRAQQDLIQRLSAKGYLRLDQFWLLFEGLRATPGVITEGADPVWDFIYANPTLCLGLEDAAQLYQEPLLLKPDTYFISNKENTTSLSLTTGLASQTLACVRKSD